MKKYVKPELFYERFELSQHIADCSIEWSNATDSKLCYAITDNTFLGGGSANMVLFIESNEKCATKYEATCYTNGAYGNNTFTS